MTCPRSPSKTLAKGISSQASIHDTFLTCCSCHSTAGLGLGPGSKGREVHPLVKTKWMRICLGRKFTPSALYLEQEIPFGSVIRVKASFESGVGKWRCGERMPRRRSNICQAANAEGASGTAKPRRSCLRRQLEQASPLLPTTEILHLPIGWGI